jgi:hypothetical protein
MAGCSLHVCRGVSRKDWQCSSISDSSVRRKRVLISKISPLQEPEPFSASSRRLYGFPVCLTAIVSMASLLISNLHSTIENRSRTIVQGSNNDSLTIIALLTQGPPTADRTVHGVAASDDDHPGNSIGCGLTLPKCRPHYPRRAWCTESLRSGT